MVYSGWTDPSFMMDDFNVICTPLRILVVPRCCMI